MLDETTTFQYTNGRSQLIGIDLFCGVGGMSLGFEQAGFNVRAAIDIDPIHTATHALNFPDCTEITADLSQISGDEIRQQAGLLHKDITAVFGGPPCQGFSRGGKHKSDDERNSLIDEFIRLLAELEPHYFVMENVDGLLAPKHRATVEQFVDHAHQAGFNVVEKIRILDANDFGVPQRRQRAFILGYRKGLYAPTYPNPLPVESQSDYPTVWDAISDLSILDEKEELIEDGCYSGPLLEPSAYSRPLQRPDPAAPLTGCHSTKHTVRTIDRFRNTKPGSREPVSRFWRLDKGGIAPTLRAGTGPENGSFTAPRPIHPISDRCLRVREAARLHSFPDRIRFHNTKWHGFRQIGNSVPPFVAKHVASSIALAEGYNS